jgi:hypothetical protein
MISRYNIYLFFLITVLLFIISCNKKKGCTDPLSFKYESGAQKDDGSCLYNYGGRDYCHLTVSWVNTSEYNIYIDGEFVGRTTRNSDYINYRSCENPISFNKILKPGKHKIEAQRFEGWRIIEYNIILNRQDCRVVYLGSGSGYYPEFYEIRN